MSETERLKVVEEFRRQGFKPVKKGLEGRYAKKLQALWIDLWNLGLIDDRSDEALLKFVRGQSKVDHTRFLIDAEAAASSIEAMKAWMAREAGVDWSVGNEVPDWFRQPGPKVVMAQWNMLANAGLVECDFAAFKRFVEDHAFNPLTRMTTREWAGVMQRLGPQVRKIRKAKRA